MIKIHQHHITSFLNCRMKFHLENNLCLVPITIPKYLNLGSAFHIGVSQYKKTGDKEKAMCMASLYFDEISPDNQEEQNQLEIGKTIVTAMLQGYFEKYPQLDYIDIERRISCYIENIKLIGTPDAVFKDKGYWLEEEKTASRIEEDYVTRLPLDFQITFYFYMAQKYYRKKFNGINYRITRTPSIRLKKNQSIGQYLNELMLDYSNRKDFYFINEKLYRSQEDLIKFEGEIKMIVRDIINCYKNSNWYRNPTICKKINCIYEKYCVSEENVIFYKQEIKPNCFSILNKEVVKYGNKENVK